MAKDDGPSVAEEFGKDLEFYQLFLLLINNSCPIKWVDLVWVKDGPAGRVGLRQKTVCTEHALNSPCASLLETRDGFDPVYCHIVNDYGCHEAESCGISDSAAEARVGKTRRAEAYRCHAGLIDIAVPVFCGDQHIATLLAGQVLAEPPSQAGFVQIRQALAPLTYIDWGKLENAYWRTPVVRPEEIERTKRVLEVFAEHLANTWKRLSSAVQDEQRKNAELQLCRKEFAHMVFGGTGGDPAALRTLMKRIGFNRYPNRVLVVRLESEREYHTPAAHFELASMRAVQAVEELCAGLANVASAYLRDRGVCVFLSDHENREGRAGFKATSLAQKVLHAIAARTDIRARVGIGGAKADWHCLLDSFHEACMALTNSEEPVAGYKPTSDAIEGLSSAVSELCHALADRRFADATRLLATLPLQANRELGSRPADLVAQRHFFSYALDSVTYTARQFRTSQSSPQRNPSDALALAGSTFELQEAFQRGAQEVVDEVRRLHAGNRQKLVERAFRKVALDLASPVTAQEISVNGVAAGLGISAGHLSRIFKRCTGITFERHVMICRVELAKKILLEPFNNVSAVADRCGFSDPTYFARVFRQIAGCSPSEYRENPMRLTPAARVDLTNEIHGAPGIPLAAGGGGSDKPPDASRA